MRTRRKHDENKIFIYFNGDMANFDQQIMAGLYKIVVYDEAQLVADADIEFLFYRSEIGFDDFVGFYVKILPVLVKVYVIVVVRVVIPHEIAILYLLLPEINL